MASKLRKQKGGKHSERRISVRAVRRDPPDLKKLSQALIALAMAHAEAEAQSEHESQQKKNERRSA
jgi:hypothetical protein